MNKLKEIPLTDITENTFTLIGTDWALLTAGSAGSAGSEKASAGNESAGYGETSTNNESAGDTTKSNTMTISWGGLGIYGNKPVSFTFIRPQRYTKQFVDTQQTFSLCFFDETYKDILKFCGTKSGKEIDKIRECNLTLNYHKGTPYFTEAKLILINRVLFQQPMEQKSFIDSDLEKKIYPTKDYHDLYISEIIQAFEKV